MVTSHPSVAEQTMLVAFTDITGFARASAHMLAQPANLLALMDAYFELVGDIVESAGGRVVKCIGDAALIVFPVEQVDVGVQALAQLKQQGDDWLARQGVAGRQQIKAHYGSVAGGPVGTRSAKLWDVYGEAVTGAARMPSSGLALSPEAFRQLRPETRRLFKKHTAQVIYIRVEDRRPA